MFSLSREACKEALRNYNSLDNPPAYVPEEQLNELEEVFRKARKSDIPTEVQPAFDTAYFRALTGLI